jgi:hypothetical protein
MTSYLITSLAVLKSSISFILVSLLSYCVFRIFSIGFLILS